MFSATFAAALVVLATSLAHGTATSSPVESRDKETVIVNGGNDTNVRGGGLDDFRTVMRKILNDGVNQFLQLPASKLHDFTVAETHDDGAVQLNGQITFQVEPKDDKIDVKELAVTVTRKVEQWRRVVVRPKETEAAAGKRVKRANGNPCGEEISAMVKSVCEKEVVLVACNAFEKKTKGQEVCFATKSFCTAAILADGICEIVG